jgi:hypothetical protein
MVRVEPKVRATRVRHSAKDGDLHPAQPNLGDPEPHPRWLKGQDLIVPPDPAAIDQRVRACHARRFLVDGYSEHDVTAGWALPGQGVHEVDSKSESTLHVGSAPPVKPTVTHDGLQRRHTPAFAHRNRVQVGKENQPGRHAATSNVDDEVVPSGLDLLNRGRVTGGLKALQDPRTYRRLARARVLAIDPYQAREVRKGPVEINREGPVLTHSTLRHRH